MAVLTDEQVIEAINRYKETHPNATRSQVLTRAVNAGEKRIKELEKAGLITLPKALTRASSSYAWRKSIHGSVKERHA